MKMEVCPRPRLEAGVTLNKGVGRDRQLAVAPHTLVQCNPGL